MRKASIVALCNLMLGHEVSSNQEARPILLINDSVFASDGVHDRKIDIKPSMQ